MNSTILKPKTTTVSVKLNRMAYSELPWRPFLGHQAWSWTTVRRGNVFITFTSDFYFCHVFLRFYVFLFLFERFFYICAIGHDSNSLQNKNGNLRQKVEKVFTAPPNRPSHVLDPIRPKSNPPWPNSNAARHKSNPPRPTGQPTRPMG